MISDEYKNNKTLLYCHIITGNQKDTICARYKSELESVQVIKYI